jgi:hypothetical protein
MLRCVWVNVVLTVVVETHHQVESAEAGAKTRGKGQSRKSISCQARRATRDITQPNHGSMAWHFIERTFTIILYPTIITTLKAPTHNANGTTNKFTNQRPQSSETKSNKRRIIRR